MSQKNSTDRHRRTGVLPPDLSAVAADWLHDATPSQATGSRMQEQVVHNFRTAAKRARALVRLFSKVLGQRTRRQENFRLRDAARALAGARDAAVAFALLHKLWRNQRGRTAAAITFALRGLNELPSTAHSAEETRTAIAHAHATLQATARRLRQLHLSPEAASKAVEAGLRASYRRSRQQMKRARATADAAEYHEWRKLTKRLFYQLQFPGLADSKGRRSLIRRLDELQERLGTEHDTQLVIGLLRSAPSRFGGTESTARVIAVLEQRGQKLRKRCLRLGAKVFSVKPEAFAKSVRRRLHHLRAEPQPA